MTPSPNHFQQVFVPVRDRPANGNIVPYYALEAADWIWLPDSADCHLAEFKAVLQLESAVETTLHISADERYELYWNGCLVGRGPDRSDTAHWSFASYRVRLEAGEHTFTVAVTNLGNKAPVAQMSCGPGFIFAAEGLESRLNTGRGAWKVRPRKGISLRPGLSGVYHVIGPGFDLHGEAFFRDTPWQEPRSVGRVNDNPHGIVEPGRILHPTSLPAQKQSIRRDFIVRSVDQQPADFEWGEADPDLLPDWKDFGQGSPLEIPAGKELRCLFDFDDYTCGYPQLTVEGGAGAEIRLEWAESLLHEEEAASTNKGNRNEWLGKFFRGFGDRFYPDGPERAFRPLWWRSGRYLQLSIRCGDKPLKLLGLELAEVGYPLEFSGHFSCSDNRIPQIEKVMRRGLESCAHEIFVDCPFYEQLSYVGDARLQALCLLTSTSDDRLVRRELELFDWSRMKNGLVAERYPSHPFQLSVTYSMIWVLMLDDFAWWRNEPAFLRERLPGMRSLIDEILRCRNDRGLLERLPGWSFMDWVDEWKEGWPPGAREGSSATVDLFFLLTLQAAARLEAALGEPELASRWSRLATEHAGAIRGNYWNQGTGLYMDTLDASGPCSIHAQCLAVIAGLQHGEAGVQLMERALSTSGLAVPSTYFGFYLYEALAQCGLGGQIMDDADSWFGFIERGLKTPPEKADPTRSDCHGWSSQPMYHLRASVAGIRPATPGFTSAYIKPQPGSLEAINCEMPTPHGPVSLKLTCTSAGVTGKVILPPGLDGEFHWNGTALPLRPGQENPIELSP